MICENELGSSKLKGIWKATPVALQLLAHIVYFFGWKLSVCSRCSISLVSYTLWSTLQALLKVLCVTSTYYAVCVGTRLIHTVCHHRVYSGATVSILVPWYHSSSILCACRTHHEDVAKFCNTKTQALWTAAVIWVTLQMNSENHSSTWTLSLLSSWMPYSLSCLSHSFLKKKSFLCSCYVAPMLMFQLEVPSFSLWCWTLQISCYVHTQPHPTATLNVLILKVKLHCFISLCYPYLILPVFTINLAKSNRQ